MTHSAATPEPSMDFARALLTGHPYRPLRRLGAGANGEVFEIEHTSMHRRFVLKFLKRRSGVDALFVDRMRIEAQAAARLRHPNIVTAIDFWITEGGSPCVVMERLSGHSLAEELRSRKQLPVLEATKYAIQTLGALSAAHALGIVHRDIKPENLLLCEVPGENRRIKVLDFGIARVLPNAATEAPNPLLIPTESGALVGTPRFMSPEALQGRRADHRSDLYSAGIVLYVMLAGHGPFDRPSANSSLDNPPPPSHWSNQELPAELEHIVHRALRERPDDRYPAALAFAEDLANLRRRLKQALAAAPTSVPKSGGG